MKYSILSHHMRLCFNHNIESTYIDWVLHKSLTPLYIKYADNYKIKNDVNILDISLFEIICDVFYSNKYQIPEWSKVQAKLKEEILHNRTSFYKSLYTEAYDQLYPPKKNSHEDFLKNLMSDEDNDIDDENIVVKSDAKSLDVNSIIITEQDFFKNLEYNRLPYLEINSHARVLAQQEVNNLDNYLIEKKLEIKALLEEFKHFMMNFVEAIKQDLSQEFKQFKFCYNLLFHDIQFFKNTNIHSLSKYKFVIGMKKDQNVGKRGKTDTFIPAGICTYGEKIFINSYNIKYGSGILSIKRDLKNILYHEVGHALDYVYFNDKVLKNEKDLQRSSYNKSFLKICKNNYSTYKVLASKLPKKYKLWLAYFTLPIKTTNNLQSTILDKEFSNVFNDVTPKKQYIYNPAENFDTKVHYKHITLNYSKPLVESWAESFAIVFDWLKNGFNEQNKLALEKGRSANRILIQLQYDSIVYMLNNFDWSLLNISYNVYLKRKRQILQYLQLIKTIPLYMNKNKKRTLKRQKFISHKQLLKSISR